MQFKEKKRKVELRIQKLKLERCVLTTYEQFIFQHENFLDAQSE